VALPGAAILESVQAGAAATIHSMTADQPDSARQPPTTGAFVANVNVVVLTYAADGLLAFVTAALVARALGAEGRGAYGLFIVSAAFGQLLLGMGVGNAAIYYLNKAQITVRDALAAVHVVCIASLAVTLLITAAIAPAFGDDVFGRGISPWLLVGAVPLLLYMNLLRLLLQALNRFVDLGVTTVGQQVIILALVAAAFATGDPSATQIVAYLLIASAAAAAYALLRIGITQIDVGAIVRPRLDTLRQLAGFGVQGEAGNVLQALNYRLDQFILRGFESLAAVGIYAVAASMTESVFILANAVALVLMPQLTASEPEEAARVTPIAARNTMLIASAGALALAAAAPVALPAVFGEAFDGSVEPLWWLLPGTVALAGSKVLTSYIFSQGRPLVNTAITAVSLAVTLTADVALIPRFGASGAAAASTLGYTVHFCAALVAYQSLSGRPALDAVLPRRDDARLYGDALRSMYDRVTHRPAAVR
jgi:O-antigen/teichoic acid export membrane protein